jgi:hypothetical protein
VSLADDVAPEDAKVLSGRLTQANLQRTRTEDADLATNSSLLQDRSTPAFVRARGFGADGAGAAVDVPIRPATKEQQCRRATPRPKHVEDAQREV